jgi:diguanylate cyclase (GGDEF)-like protein
MTPPRDRDVYEDLYLSAPFGYLSTSSDGMITRVNDTLLAWLGRTRDTVEGRRFAELLEPGSRIFFETRHQPVLHLTGSLEEIALLLEVDEGPSLPVLINSTVVRGVGDEVREIRIALTATPGRHAHERAMVAARREAEASEGRVRLLQEASAAFVLSESEADLTERLVLSARDATGARGIVLLADDEGVLRAVAGDPLAGGDAIPPTAAAAIDRPEGRAAQFRAPIALGSRAEILEQFPALAVDDRLEALSVVPIVADERALGVLVWVFGRARDLGPALLELQWALARLTAQVLQRLRLQAELQRLALHDQLTGLANRARLTAEAEAAVAAARDDGQPLAILFFDLDGFKRVNDQLGHGAGDEVLKQVAARTLAAVRAHDLVARFGGDEFVVICAATDLEAAAAIAERLRAGMAEPLDGIALPVTASVGVVLFDPTRASGVTSELLLDRADAAMYRSKNEGRDRVTLEIVESDERGGAHGHAHL